MSALAPALLSSNDITLDQAVHLFESITDDDHSVARPLFLLLRGVVDPEGNKQRFAIADAIMRRAIVRTPEFEEWYKTQLVA